MNSLLRHLIYLLYIFKSFISIIVSVSKANFSGSLFLVEITKLSITLAPRILTFSSSLLMFESPRLASIVANRITSFPFKSHLSIIVKIAGVGLPFHVGVPKYIVSYGVKSTLFGEISVFVSLNALIDENSLFLNPSRGFKSMTLSRSVCKFLASVLATRSVFPPFE